MSNRNFDNRVIIQRLQNKNYVRNLYINNVNGGRLINNPQNTDGNSSRQNTYTSGVQTEYFRGLLDGAKTVSLGGTFGISPFPLPTASTIPSAPTITGITSGNQELSVAFTAGATGGSVITNYKYSTDNGTTFRAFDPVNTTSPLVITTLSTDGTTLINGTTYQIKILAVNANGDGAASTTVNGTPSTPP
jgi:hypothetical protein